MVAKPRERENGWSCVQELYAGYYGKVLPSQCGRALEQLPRAALNLTELTGHLDLCSEAQGGILGCPVQS